MRTIRRSVAKDLPPAADDHTPSVLVKRAQDFAPAAGSCLRVLAPCGVELNVRVTSVDPDDTGWAAWAEVLSGFDAALRAQGVPGPADAPMRIFSHQVVR